jgi:type IV secretion system protein TrbL
MGALRSGTSMGAAAGTAYRLGQETSGSRSVGEGLGGVARAGAAMAREKVGAAAGLGAAAERGRRSAMFAGSGAGAAPAASGGGAAADEAPQWARRLRSEQNARHHRHAALQAVREGDRGGSAANPDISERED